MTTHSKTFRGIKISAGIAIGKAVVFSHTSRDITRRIISPDEIYIEKDRFISAIKLIIDQTDYLIGQMNPKELKKIGPHLHVQKMILSDLRFIEDVKRIISTDLVNCETAVSKAFEKYSKLLHSKEKALLNAKSTDLKSIEFLLLRVLSGKIKDISLLNEEHILITNDLTPAELYYYSKQKVVGIATETGGRNSHTSIVARSLNIPAVSGIQNITQIINTMDNVIIDGHNGILIHNPSNKQIQDYSSKKVSFCLLSDKKVDKTEHMFVSKDGQRINIYANIDFPEEVETALSLGADGIGLLRTEFYFIERPRAPSEEEQFKSYDTIAAKFYPKEVTIRTLDVGGEKIPGFISQHKEENPALGIRAIRFCLRNKNLFLTQIKAILRASHRGNVKILIPMISKIDELTETINIIQEAKDILTKENKKFDPNIKLGIMLEIPSVIFTLEDMAEYVDFFSLGTNDLVQFIMAVDRGNIELFDSASSTNPAMIRVLKIIFEKIQKINKPIYVCGEMAAEDENITVLLGLGYRNLSMSPVNIPLFENLIRKIHIHKAESLVNEIIKMKSEKEIKMILERFLNEES
ncbi:MAG: phosphoenolpyruvate--protein phosphotransferase [Deltaproteobacteria bacterium]|nr:phosphoenolpyruvate--protein phosphotransferase [Deltaproteobacteria bacterium]